MTHAYAGVNGTVAFLAGKESYETAFASAPLTACFGRCVSAALLRTRVRRIPLCELWECQLDLDKLREEKCAFDVYEVSKEGKSQMWAVVTGYCQYGGCDIPTFFGNELFARIYAITLTKLGREPTIIGICPECHDEFWENSI